jgi:TM2 domain.
MKFGIRKPSLKKSLKARTTGKMKRAAKKAIIPGYGKKGTGWIKNPKKAAYNAVYSRTTVGVSDIVKSVNNATQQPNIVINNSNMNTNTNVNTGSGKQKNKWVALALCIFTVCGHKIYEGKIGMAILYTFTGGLLGIGWIVDIITLLLKPNPYYV